MDLGDRNQGGSIGNYTLGPSIGSGSFAVVWRARHRQSGTQVAVKEIDKKQLSPKVADNLLKEISILSDIRHPNIVRLFEAIETEDRIYLVLEYCDGGDLAGYIHRCGKVSEAVAKHFMRQLAAGLKVLNENRLIHRDLKPQNLLLSTNEAAPLLKIGDFGFARYLTPQGLADTLCGSPLYMAPEIIQNKKYDGKADLWSVGAILFQLVTGKPPFDGDNHFQLFQNILTSSELRFPQGALQVLNPDCVALCRGLLRHNPVERLTFEEFFDHKFLAEARDSEISSSSSLPGDVKCRKDHGSIFRPSGIGEFIRNTACDRLRTSLEGDVDSSDQLPVTDSMESIEKDYVIVSAHFASMETFSCSLETSLLSNPASRVFSGAPKKNARDIDAAMKAKAPVASPVRSAKIAGSQESDLLAASSASTILREVQGLSVLHPSTRLQLLHQYICTLSELAQVKFSAGLFLESFSVELVVLAIWKNAIQVCSSWLASATEGDVPGSCSVHESTPVQEGSGLSPYSEETVDFSIPQSVSMWAEQGFLVALDRAEKLSNHIQDMDGNVQMPDAMEIIFQTALHVGKNGGVDELMGKKSSAAASYSKAVLLLSFIVGEATALPLNPPFLLTPADGKRIEGYIINFKSRQSHFQMSPSSSKQSLDPLSK
ncbi:serine/threonine-protein kinase ATG1a [Cornus florida]|uniref:serine/threonine-protein kinase ATG1a n=1 Tax=Cornus florida TaxID=4283 RepID=UPI0028A01301|nr:serine/threonine-protein kinase ATG1a [Cornus florida]